MLKPSNNEDYDDISLKPITDEDQVLLSKPNPLDDEKVKKLLEELDAIESANCAPTAPLHSQNNIALDSSKTETKRIQQTSYLVSEETPLKQSKTSYAKPTKLYLEPANESSKNSLLKVVLVSFVTLAITAGAIVYSFLQPTAVAEETTATILPSEPQEQFADISDQAVNIVKNSISKTAGSTIEQALANYLNSSIGEGWQALGWKSEFQQKNNYLVKFIWKESTSRKEASWQLDSETKELIPKDSVAEEVTPIKAPVNSSAVNVLQNSQPTK
ncbi:MAG: hypothetical protein HY819_20260 [Acidobacteria bacterium]|nr:hypothetical protein [Acidobacteriota bacterium]